MSSVNQTEKRIDLLRSLMIFGVVVLHTPPYIPIAQTGSSPFELMVAFFQHAVFRTTVPVLTFISGYLLFRSSLDTRPMELLQKKFKSIVIPFLIFNLTLVGALLLLREGAGMTVGNASMRTTGEWLNATLGLTAEPVNYPLNFLRNLVALFIAAPVIGILLRKAPWPGLLLALIVFYYNLDGDYLLRDTMGPVFYMGGMAAVLKWDMRRLDRHAPVLLGAFLVACAGIVWFHIANTSYLQLLAPLLVWPAASLLAGTAFGERLQRMSKYSYFLFLAHAPVLLVVSLIYKKYSEHIPFPMYWVAAPLIVTAIVIGVYELAMRTWPRAFAFAIGCGHRHASARRTFVDRRLAPRPAGAPVYSPEVRGLLLNS